MTLFSDMLNAVFERRLPGLGPAIPDRRPTERLIADLLSATGEVSGFSVARAILDRFDGMADAGKLAFFRHLATGLTIDPERVRHALDALEQSQTRDSYRDFMAAAEPPRQELIRRLNQVPGATGALVRMRADLLRLGREDPDLMALDLDFRHLFASWFNRGFLLLRPISWQTPASVLEKIIAYEAVHAIDTWDALRARLAPSDRRCFAFFHPAMPDEPLIFVEVALMQGIPGRISDVLAEDRSRLRAAQADTAVFYSISNCQPGLAGISFGNSLIKQVAADLSTDLPNLKTFVTLSPIPGLVAWARTQGLTERPATAEQRRRIAAHYLLNVKGRGHAPADPVARFHLGNGALVHQVHADADPSPKGEAQSWGTMVNYLYPLARIAQNHEGFVSRGEIATTSALRSLAAAGAAELKPGQTT